MLKLVLVLSFTTLLTFLAPFTAADAQTVAPNQTPALPAPPLQCVAGSVRIEALPDTFGNFPVPVSCPANSLGAASCLKWSYRYALLSGNTISLSALTVDSDVDIVAATGGSPESGSGMKVYAPGESDSAIGLVGNNTFDLRTVKFSANGAVVLGNIYTKTDVAVGSVTAISKVGNSGASVCRIAGPDNISGASVGLATVTTTQIDQFQECQITLTLDAKGCPTNVQASPSTCQVTEVDSLSGDAKKVLGGQCKGGTSGLVTDGSTCVWYCPTSYGTCFKVCK